jgi:Fe-S-cluster containining protein
MGKLNFSLAYRKPEKLSFDDDIRIHPWLIYLVEAYFIIDKGVSVAIGAELKKKRILACKNKCSNCCKTHKDIPVYPLELVGISWYVVEKISGEKRGLLKKQLMDYEKDKPCPFLIDDSCIIHPMRPIACRQFIVFNKPCGVNEDPYYTRKQDVLIPYKRYTDEAFFIMLPFYGVRDEDERRRIIEKGSMHVMVKTIQTCNWKTLAEKMDEFDLKSSKR